MNEHAIAVLLSLLDPSMVSAYLDGASVVSEDYVINPANFVNYPDVLRLFNNKEERIEFYMFLNTLPEGHCLRFDLYGFNHFIADNSFAKTAMIGMVIHILMYHYSTRCDISSIRCFHNFKMGSDCDIYELIDEEVNNLLEFGYFSICYASDKNSLIRKPNGPMLSKFRTIGRAIVDTYTDYRKMLEGMGDVYWMIVGDDIRYELTANELPLFLVQNYYYSCGNDVKSINLKTLAIVSKAFYIGQEEVLKHIHLDPVSFIKQQKNIHSIALECVDELPINNLTKIYKNIVDFSEGRTTMFYLESAQYII